jgi:hypothetical protein
VGSAIEEDVMRGLFVVLVLACAVAGCDWGHEPKTDKPVEKPIEKPQEQPPV